jgi:hypothetical protein
VVDALHCAVEVQRGLVERNEGAPPDAVTGARTIRSARAGRRRGG